jgi:phospholipid/cholesterol/gamma-HCH transport system permease protein
MARHAQEQEELAGLSIEAEDGLCVVRPRGEWTVEQIGRFDRPLRKLARDEDAASIVIDVSALDRLDTAGAYLLGRTLGPGRELEESRVRGEHRTARRLIEETRGAFQDCPSTQEARRGPVAVFASIGQALESFVLDAVDTFDFFGRTVATAGRTLVQPWRLRWTATVSVMETAGVNALPIVAVLAFFIGAVVAYMGADLLQTFGVSVFTVELVGVAVLREFGVLITAIMLAGRSDSAFTASIGSMKMQQEIDAMRVLGLDPFEVLVLPRVIACVLMAPLLTFAAMLSGLFGGMVVSWGVLDISPNFFIDRLQSSISWEHFFVGISKAPVFGMIIAVIGCHQGMKVGGDVESLGERTTASVVHAIFAVIVVDALFAMLYLELGI